MLNGFYKRTLVHISIHLWFRAENVLEAKVGEKTNIFIWNSHDG